MATTRNKDAPGSAGLPANPALAVPMTSRPGPALSIRLESADLTVLEAVMSQSEPVTRGRIARLVPVPPAQLALALGALCDLGLLRRLNTIVESYTTRLQ